MPSAPALALESRLCNGFGATDVQAQFPSYRVAVCIQGMGPTHMKVQGYGQPKTIRLTRVEMLPEGGWYYQAENGSMIYTLTIKKNAIAELQIVDGDNYWKEATRRVEFVEAIPPR
ncbi:hypothetical protein [Leptolyngbya sp. 'hensonii']|uniref:hypothetical protein n=1 Tax=Leptolyngbya sp. 'hensonii' TaxID=1922337 RepID=UPI0011802A6D|nr:hypothetical protein [Leptolyngbya sp. 'hensonii']